MNKYEAMRGLLEELRHARPLLLYGEAWIAQIEVTLATPDDAPANALEVAWARGVRDGWEARDRPPVAEVCQLSSESGAKYIEFLGNGRSLPVGTRLYAGHIDED